MLQFEGQAADANITHGWDALWYSIVTITTVGYGDFYPVSLWGRVTAIFVMVLGVGLIGVIASLLSGLLIGDQSDAEQEQASALTATSALEQEIASINEKLEELRQLLKDQKIENAS